MNSKIIKVNNKYNVKITYNDNSDIRYYRLIDNNDKVICDGYNRDSFLIKANKIVKLTNNIELLIASI